MWSSGKGEAGNHYSSLHVTHLFLVPNFKIRTEVKKKGVQQNSTECLCVSENSQCVQ